MHKLMRLVITHVPTGKMWYDRKVAYTSEKYSEQVEELKNVMNMDQMTICCHDAGQWSHTVIPAKILHECVFEVKIGAVNS